MRAHERTAIETQAAEWRAEAKNWEARVGDGPVVRVLTTCAAELDALVRSLAATVTLLTVAQYAREHGRTPSTVRRWCQAGALEADKRGGDWMIPADAKPDFAKVRKLQIKKVG